MTKLNTGFVFGYYPGDHFTVATKDYEETGYKFLQQKYNDFMNHASGSGK
jgi:hypothetical protein